MRADSIDAMKQHKFGESAGTTWGQSRHPYSAQAQSPGAVHTQSHVTVFMRIDGAVANGA